MGGEAQGAWSAGVWQRALAERTMPAAACSEPVSSALLKLPALLSTRPPYQSYGVRGTLEKSTSAQRAIYQALGIVQMLRAAFPRRAGSGKEGPRRL